MATITLSFAQTSTYKSAYRATSSNFYYYTATFTPSKPCSSLSITLAAGATTSADMGTDNYRNQYFRCAIYPESKSFTPTASNKTNGQRIDGWTYGSKYSTSATLTFSKDSDSAAITSKKYKLYVWGDNTSSNYTCSGNITPSGTGTVQTVTYTLTCKSGSNQATSNTYTSTSVDYGTSATANITTAPAAISGWTALGWRDDTSAAAKTYNTTGNVTLSANKTVYAVYSRDASFKSGNDVSPTVTNQTQYYNTGNTYSVVAPATSTMTALTGWTKSKWRTNTYAGRNENDSTIVIAGGATYTGSAQEFFAEYTATVHCFSGSSHATVTDVTAYYATTYGNGYLVLPAESSCAAITGFTKQGWLANTQRATTSGLQSWGAEQWWGRGSDNFPTAVRGYYALYSKTITVTYNANSGSGAPGNSTGTQYYNTWGNYADPSIELSATIPTRTNYEFLGWGTSSSATTASYQPNTSYTFSANTTIYAVWRIMGIVRIYNGSSWDNYFVYIYNGSNWNDKYTPFVYDGSTWVRCI